MSFQILPMSFQLTEDEGAAQTKTALWTFVFVAFKDKTLLFLKSCLVFSILLVIITFLVLWWSKQGNRKRVGEEDYDKHSWNQTHSPSHPTMLHATGRQGNLKIKKQNKTAFCPYPFHDFHWLDASSLISKVTPALTDSTLTRAGITKKQQNTQTDLLKRRVHPWFLWL